jgi:Zn-dependent protease with chaperone function
LYFDGRSGHGRPVRLELGAGTQANPSPKPRARAKGAELLATPLEIGLSNVEVGGTTDSNASAPLRWPLSQVQWPESTRHARRVLQLAGGGQFEVADAAAFDAWRQGVGAGESWVVRAQQHWRSTLVALAVLVALVLVGYRWGVPWAADLIVVAVPARVDQAVGEAALESLSTRWLEPSQLAPARQQALRAQCTAALAAALPASERPAWTLHFHAGASAMGANAFALPGGAIVITDEMVKLLEGQDDALVGVIAHEFGHVQQRHGMRALARLALVSLATAVALGDFSTVLAGVPAVMAQLAYSRDAEREADQVAARVLQASGRQPEAMLVLFERLQAQRGAAAAGGLMNDLPIALASHPADEERVRFFREYGRVGAR